MPGKTYTQKVEYPFKVTMVSEEKKEKKLKRYNLIYIYITI